MDRSGSSNTAAATRRHLKSIVSSTRPGPSSCQEASRGLGDGQMPELPSSPPLCPSPWRRDRVRSWASPTQAVERGAPRPARRASIGAKARSLDLFVVCVSCLMNTPVHRSRRPGIFGSTNNRLERHPSTDEATTRPCWLSLVVRDPHYNDPSCTRRVDGVQRDHHAIERVSADVMSMAWGSTRRFSVRDASVYRRILGHARWRLDAVYAYGTTSRRSTPTTSTLHAHDSTAQRRSSRSYGARRPATLLDVPAGELSAPPVRRPASRRQGDLTRT